MQRAKDIIKTVANPLFWSLSYREYTARPASSTPDDIVKFLWSYKGQGWYARLAPFQQKDEFTELLMHVQKIAPKRAMEIGTARGGSLFAFAQYTSEMLISVDLDGGKYGKGYPRQRRRLYERFAPSGSKLKIYFVDGDSHSETVRSRILDLLDSNKLDFIFIDGDHSYEGVKSDFEFSLKVVAKTGTIALHDICPHQISSCNVDRFWNEIKDLYATQEIVADPKQGWAGIGIVRGF